MLIPWIIAFKLYILPVHGQFHYNQYNFWLQSPTERSVDVMTDVVNELGILILQQYTGHGNVAFSPTGVGFVLIALYEGSAGKGKQQIGHALGLPRSDQVTRVGMRDIHRRLRSYLNADGFLGGLTLNKDNINLRPEYENILKFYGFDLSNVTSSGPNITEASNATRNTDGTTEIATNAFTMQTSTMPGVSSGMITETPPTLSTINNAASTMSSNSDGSAGTDATTILTTANVPMTTLGVPVRLIDMSANGSGTNSDAITTGPPSGATTLPPTSQDAMTTMTNPQPNLNPAPEATTIAGTVLTNASSSPLTDAATGSSTDSGNSIPMAASVQTTTNDAAPTSPPDLTTTVNIPTTLPAGAMPLMTNDSNPRRKRSTSNFFNYSPDDGSWMQDLNAGYQHPRQAGDYDPQDENRVPFLINGCDVISVPAATYSTILPFAYFPSLKAVALEFPLDDPRYNILIFLPTEWTDTFHLVRDLRVKSLRLLRKHLQSTWVKARIPSFMLRGFVTLTPFLQRLGIKDVFEPRIADLSPMTPDLGVYARDVQQSIAVNIRNDMKVDELNARQQPTTTTPEPDTSSRLPPRRDSYRFLHPDAFLEKGGPASFIVERPFLYFIIDDHTSVTLIAGRVDDPLNSRIL